VARQASGGEERRPQGRHPLASLWEGRTSGRLPIGWAVGWFKVLSNLCDVTGWGCVVVVRHTTGTAPARFVVLGGTFTYT
jgi:hypothetical protein